VGWTNTHGNVLDWKLLKYFELLHQYHENVTNIMYYTMQKFWGTLS